MLKRTAVWLSVGLLLILAGCSALPVRDTVTQTSTIDALLAGAYDGNMTCDHLLTYGDLGIGTFDRLDGEMVLVDGRVYQVRADGRVYTPDTSLTTPFAAVCAFSPDRTFTLDNGLDYDGVQQMLNQLVPNQNLFCAVKMSGTFTRMHTRSVPAQEKPYPPLAEVTRHQPEFHMENISGQIVGFRCPAYVKGINVPGYHLHFISDDRTRGGHILGFETAAGSGGVDVCDRFLLLLPQEDEMFGAVDLTRDRGAELEAVEQ